MTKLEKLIKELCPYGVVYRKLKELCISLSKGTLKQHELCESGFPVVNSGRDFYGRYNQCNNKGNAITIASRGEYAGFIKYINEEFWAGGLCYPYRSWDEKVVLTKFIFYYLKNNETNIMDVLVSHGGVPALNKSDIDDYKIPLPPLAVQCEIVRILDDYADRVKILQCKLQEELGDRRKQYEYYRDKFLSFDKLNEGREVRWLKLKEIAMIKTGTKPVEIFSTGKYEYVNAGTGNSGYVDSYNMVGDVVTTPSRGQGGIGYVGYQSNAFWLGPLCYSIQSQDSTIASNKFLYYLLVQQRNDILAAKKEGGIPALNAKDLLAIKLPLPPLEVQEKIVETLDHFDALCNDLSEGLSAEIEARQKQYEYYRDKLLSFKECV